MATIQVSCRFCAQQKAVRKHVKGVAGYQRFRCLDCKRPFQLDYAYEASKPGVKEKLIEMAMHRSSIAVYHGFLLYR
jgi:transposase-like protein